MISTCMPSRVIMVAMGFLGFVIVYALRVNLSVAMVAMTNNTGKSGTNDNFSSAECPQFSNNTNNTQESMGEFDWDEETQGLILGAFFWGYIFTQIPGGMLAEIYGAKWIYGCGILSISVLTLLTPLAARWGGVPLLVVLRVLEGIGEGVTFPAMHALLSRWVPPLERTTLGVITYSGAQFGTVISLPISGVLCSSDIMGGWPSVFYIFGIAGCIWFIPWCFLVYSSPSEHPRISHKELEYITSTLQHSVTNKRPHTMMPLRSILLSPRVIALMFGHMAYNWGFYFLLTSLPIFLSRVLNFNIKEDGFVSSLPYVALWIVSNLSGYFADLFRSKGWLSTTAVRKLFNTSGLLFETAGLIMVGYIGCDRLMASTALVITGGLSGLCAGGYAMNHLDLAPQYAGTLLGLTNTVSTIPGMVAPVVVGAFTNHNETRAQWLKVFYTSSSIIFAGAIVFALFGSGELQPWAVQEIKEDSHSNDDTTNEEDDPTSPLLNPATIQT